MILNTESPTLPLFTVEDVRSTPDQFIAKLNQLVDTVQTLIDNNNNP